MALPLSVNAKENLYAAHGYAYNNGATLVEDNGNTWYLEDAPEFEEGERIRILFDSKGNEDIYDDEIIDVVPLLEGNESRSDIYPKTAVVSKVDYKNDVVTVKDYSGNLWEFYGCEDWETGDVCSMIMSTNGTTKTLDDIIIKTEYSGKFEKGEWK